MKKPVLFIIFSRTQTALEVLGSIASYAPERLYISADGPRAHVPGEAEKCEETRKKVLEAINWPCEIFTRFLDTNMGCGPAPSSAKNWFFEHEESGIILEDDCVPIPEFFQYAETLLDRYADREDIFMINGINYFVEKSPPVPYFLSRITQIPCFATWRRAWKHFSYSFNDSPEEIYRVVKNIHPDPLFHKIWVAKFLAVQEGKRTDVWDYQWSWTIWKNRAFAITPQFNMVRNIGFGTEATHHHDEGNQVENLPTRSIDWQKPVELKHYPEYDDALCRKIYGIRPVHTSLKTKLTDAIKAFLSPDYRETLKRNKSTAIQPYRIPFHVPIAGKNWLIPDVYDYFIEEKLFIKGNFWDRHAVKKWKSASIQWPLNGFGIHQLRQIAPGIRISVGAQTPEQQKVLRENLDNLDFENPDSEISADLWLGTLAQFMQLTDPHRQRFQNFLVRVEMFNQNAYQQFISSLVASGYLFIPWFVEQAFPRPWYLHTRYPEPEFIHWYLIQKAPKP